MKTGLRATGLLILIISFFGQVSVYAQELAKIDKPAPGDTVVLTFLDAVKIVLRNGLSLNQQRNQLELNQLFKTSSIASILPSVSVNATAARTEGNQFNQQLGIVNGVQDNINGSLNVNMTLFNGFYRLNTIRQYTAALDAQSYFVNRTAQDAINTVGTQYLQVLLDMELVRIAKDNLDVQEKQLNMVKAFVEAGTRSQVDEYNQDALTKAAELRYVQAKVTLNTDQALLTQTLLIDPFDEFKVQKPAWNLEAISMDQTDMTTMLNTAMQYRADYRRAVTQETSQKFGMRASRSAFAPNLSAFYTYSSAYNYQYNLDSAGRANPRNNREFNQQFREDNVRKNYGLSLNIPIFNGLQNRVTYVQQRVQYENAILNKQSVEFQLRNDVKRTATNFDGIRQAYQISLARLRAAELAFQFETERYNLGITAIIDYSTANNAYIQALTDKAQAEYRLLFQKIQLEYTLGTLKVEDLQ
jgi:outer membrane protein